MLCRACINDDLKQREIELTFVCMCVCVNVLSICYFVCLFEKVDIVPKALLRYQLTELPTPEEESLESFVTRSRLRALRPYLEQMTEDQREKLLRETLTESGLSLSDGILSREATSMFPRLKDASGAFIHRFW